MSARMLVLVIVLALFGALSVTALLDVGYWGIIKPHFQSWGAGQVLADLTIMCLLGCSWMVRDAAQRGVNPWPFVLVTLVAGSFGPLSYLLLRELGARKQEALAT